MKLILKISIISLTFFIFSCGGDIKLHEFSYYLENGKIDKGIEDYTNYMKENEVDDQFTAEFGLLKIAKTFENFLAEFYLILSTDFYTEMSIDVPEDREQNILTYEHFIEMLSGFYNGLEESEKILSKIKNIDIKIPLYIGKFYFDIDKDGKVKDWEWLPNFFKEVLPVESFPEEELEEFYIGFDYSDILWLRGYCNLIMHFINFARCYNWSPHFYSYLTPNNFSSTPICKIPVSKEINLFSFDAMRLNSVQMRDKNRLNNAHTQILKVIELSRETWQAILGEEDDDQEWLPSPNQRGIFFDILITEDFVETWHSFLSDAEDVLMGDIWIPYKLNEGLYINLKKYYDNPKTFNILDMATNLDRWLEPYLEQGEIVETEPFITSFFNIDEWLAPLQERFNNEFLSTAAYVN